MKELKVSPSPYVVIEGNVGVGKSTFLSLLDAQLAVPVIPEPHHRWLSVGGENVLDLFYKNPKRWAYTFQSYAFITRIQEMMAHQSQHTHVMHVLERSVFSDRYCFAALAYELGNMSLLEWELYQEVFTWLVGACAIKPYGIIYLQADPDTCYKRISKRNRKEEAGVPYEYIVNLHEKHEKWLIEKVNVAGSLSDVPVLVISADEDFEHTPELRNKHVQKVQDFLVQITSPTSLLHATKSLSL